jgi:hypothetical protein
VRLVQSVGYPTSPGKGVPCNGWLNSAWGGTIGPMTKGMDEIAVLIRKALAAEDLSAFTELLDPAVTWGAPGARNPSCKTRNQVLAWYQRGRDSGVRGSVYDVEVLGDRLLVSMSVRGTENARERGGAALRFQVFAVRSGKVVDIVGFDNKTEALSYVS